MQNLWQKTIKMRHSEVPFLGLGGRKQIFPVPSF